MKQLNTITIILDDIEKSEIENVTKSEYIRDL